jgi:hypothetical protein
VEVGNGRWDRGDSERAGENTFFYEKRSESHELGTHFFAHKRIISAVKRVEFVSIRMLYIILRVRWCDVIVMKVRVATEDKVDDVKDSLYDELECVFSTFLIYEMKILMPK